MSATTLGGENYFFTTRERGELQLQGKVKPVSVLRSARTTPGVSNRYEARDEDRTARPHLLGRARFNSAARSSSSDRELRDLIAGASRDVAIVGSAGMREKPAWSKSFCSARLFFHRRFAGVIARTHLAAEPLQPFRQMLRQLSRPSPELQRVLSLGLLSRQPDALSNGGRRFHGAVRSVRAEGPREAPDPVHRRLGNGPTMPRNRWSRHCAEARPGSMLISSTASREPPTEAGQGPITVLELPQFNRQEAAEAIEARRPDVDPLRGRSNSGAVGWRSAVHRRAGATRRCRIGDSSVDDCSDNCPAWLSTLIDSRVEQLRLLLTTSELGPIWPLSLGTGRIPARACSEAADRRQPDDPILQDLADIDARCTRGRSRARCVSSTASPAMSSMPRSGSSDWEMLHRRIGNLLEARAALVGWDSAPRAALVTTAAPAPEPRTGRRTTRELTPATERWPRLHLTGPAIRTQPRSRRWTPCPGPTRPTPDGWSGADIGSAWPVCSIQRGIGCRFSIVRRPLQLSASITPAGPEPNTGSGSLAMITANPRTPSQHAAGSPAVAARRRLETPTSRAIASGILEMQALSVQLLATMGQARAAAGEHDAALALLDESLAVKQKHRRSGRPAEMAPPMRWLARARCWGISDGSTTHTPCLDEALEISAGHSAVEGDLSHRLAQRRVSVAWMFGRRERASARFERRAWPNAWEVCTCSRWDSP